MRISELKATTDYIHPDEPCYGVIETDFIAPDFTVHRYRLTYVARADQKVPYVQDLTEAGIYSTILPAPPVQLVSFGDDRVGEAWDTVEHMAHGRDSAKKRLAELREKAEKDKDIINAMVERTEQYKEFVTRNPRTVASIQGVFTLA